MAYKVPAAIRKIASDAIEQNLKLPISQRAAYKDEGKSRVAGTGMRTARRLVSGSVSRQQLVLMRAWFARHGESEKEKQKRKDKTSKASIAWRLWGGTGARTWVNALLRGIERKER